MGSFLQTDKGIILKAKLSGWKGKFHFASELILLVGMFSFLCHGLIRISEAGYTSEEYPSRCGDAQLCLTVDDEKTIVEVILNKGEDQYYATTWAPGFSEGPFRLMNNRVNWKLQGSPNERVVNKLELMKEVDSEIIPYCEIEIAKESAAYLKKQFHFTMERGYLIIKRSTCNISAINQQDVYAKEEIHEISDQDKAGMMMLLQEFDPEAKKLLEINRSDEQTVFAKAELITRFLWDLYRATGPCDLMQEEMSTLEKLKTIKDKGGTVQCTGTRDFFIDIAHSLNSGLVIRKVDTFRYLPFIPNIVVNSHSVLEIKINDKWVLFDPFVRVYFRNRKGEALSANDIRMLRYQKKLYETVPIHVLTKREQSRAFETENNPYDPYGYNYFCHFNNIKYTLQSFLK
jgi:hypothetical protein